MRFGHNRDTIGRFLSRNWRLIVPALLIATLLYFSGQNVFRTVVAVSGPYVFRSFGTSALAVLGPALLLYGSIYCGIALLQAARGNQRESAPMVWEAVVWGALGAMVTLAQGQPRLALSVVLLVAAALLFEQRTHWQRWAYRALLELTCLAVAIAMLLPVIWMLVASLRAPGLPQPTQLEWWPQSSSLANYTRLWQLIPLGLYLRNSLFVAAIGVPGALLVAAAAAFALVQFPARWRRPVLALSVVGLAVPAMALWLPRFVLFRWLGLLNTPFVLLYPLLLGGSPLCVLLLYSAFRRVPSAIWEQARIDGAGLLRTWWQIGLPQVTGMLVALGALVFRLCWGEFIDPLLYLSDNSWRTLPVGLQALQQLTRSDWPVLMAAAMVMLVPALLVFVLAQRALVLEP